MTCFLVAFLGRVGFLGASGAFVAALRPPDLRGAFVGCAVGTVLSMDCVEVASCIFLDPFVEGALQPLLQKNRIP